MRPHPPLSAIFQIPQRVGGIVAADGILVLVLALVIGLLARVFDYDYEDDDEDDMKIAPSGKEIQDGLAQAVAGDVEGALLDFVA